MKDTKLPLAKVPDNALSKLLNDTSFARDDKEVRSLDRKSVV